MHINFVCISIYTWVWPNLSQASVHRLSPSFACPNEPPNPLIVQFPPDFVSVSGLRPVLPGEVLCFCDADVGPGREDGGRSGRGKILSKV